MSVRGAGVGAALGVAEGAALSVGEGFGVAISLSTAGCEVGFGVGVAGAPGGAITGIAMPRSPIRTILPTPKSTNAVMLLATATAAIRSSACFTAISNGALGASERVGPAYPARHR